jgi:hypothetical protein
MRRGRSIGSMFRHAVRIRLSNSASHRDRHCEPLLQTRRNAPRRDAPEGCKNPWPRNEGVGNAGCSGTRSRACSVVVVTRVSHHEYPDHPAFPHAMVLTVSSELSPVTNSFLSPSSTDMTCLSPVGPTHLRQLSISNGCQDHTALPYASAPFVSTPFDRCNSLARLTLPRPPHPAPRL